MDNTSKLTELSVSYNRTTDFPDVRSHKERLPTSIHSYTKYIVYIVEESDNNLLDLVNDLSLAIKHSAAIEHA